MGTMLLFEQVSRSSRVGNLPSILDHELAALQERFQPAVNQTTLQGFRQNTQMTRYNACKCPPKYLLLYDVWS
jgi:hypothetical protein